MLGLTTIGGVGLKTIGGVGTDERRGILIKYMQFLFRLSMVLTLHLR